MQIEYLTDQQIVSWGTVFQYDSRDNLISNSNINSWVTYPYTNVDYGVGRNDLGFISPLAGASAVILDIDVADESDYTASNVRVKVRPQAEGGGIINPSTGENIMSGEMEAVNLRGFQRAPSSKQVQVLVPVNINGTFDYAYEVSGELPLLRHIKIVGKVSEFDVESLNQGTKISQLPFSEAEVDDMFVVSRFEDDEGRKFLATKAFKKSDFVLLCPIYAAGEKKNVKFKKIEFAKLISKLSSTQVIIVNSFEDIKKYFQKHLIKNEIVIGMGAGLVSKHMRGLKESL